MPEIAHRKWAKDETASVKSDIVLPVHYDNIQKVNKRHGIQRIDPNESQTRVRGVIDLSILSASSDDEAAFSFACLRQNGCVEVWQGGKNAHDEASRKSKFAHYQRISLSNDIFEKSRQDSLIPNVPVKPLAMAAIPHSSNNSEQRLLAADTHGNMVILKAQGHQPVSILKQFSAFSNSPDNITLTYTKGKVINTQLASALVMHPSEGQAAIGGRERDIRLFDLETCRSLWKAKNLPPDPQTLMQQPIWPSAMVFVQEGNEGNHSNLLAVGTGFAQIRLYDVRSQPAASVIRRPIRFTPESSKFIQHRITAICQTGEHQVVVGDTTGDLHALDLRYNLNGKHGDQQIDGTSSLGRYVGPAGSVRQIAKHPTLPIVAVVGCDRMLRTYNTQTQKIVDCVYLKQRLNCVLACPEGQTEGFDEDEVVEVVGDGVAGNMDQDDVVEDYVNTSDEENDFEDENDSDSASEDGSTEEERNLKSNKNKVAIDGDKSSEEDQDNSSESGSDSASGSKGSEEDSDEKVEAPRKRRRK